MSAWRGSSASAIPRSSSSDTLISVPNGSEGFAIRTTDSGSSHLAPASRFRYENTTSPRPSDASPESYTASARSDVLLSAWNLYAWSAVSQYVRARSSPKVRALRNMTDAKAIQKEVAHQRTVRSTPTHDHSPLGNLTLLAAFQAAALRASRDDLSKLDGEEVTTKTFEARLIAALVYETAVLQGDES